MTFKIFLQIIGLSLCLGSSFFVYANPISVETLLAEAQKKQAIGDYAGAAKAYKQILDINANHGVARVGLAAVLMKAELNEHESDQSEAVRVAIEHKSVPIQPSLEALLAEAKSKHAHGDRAGAAMVYKQILDIDANYPEAQVGLSAVLIEGEL